MPRCLILLFLILSVSLYAEESEQINVRLATDSQLMPIYLAKFQEESSGFEPGFIQGIEKVLQFDLNHNGATYTIAQNAENEKLANRLMLDGVGDAKAWRPVSIFYVIKVQAKSNKTLIATLYAVNGDTAKKIDGITLTGNLAKDRRQIHQLADAIYKTLLGTNGVATTHILYTIKKRDTGEDKKWVSEIWEMDYDGANAHPVIQNGAYNISPVYVPPKVGFNSSNFFYVAYQSAQPKIFMASLKEGVGRRFSYLRGNQLMPAISKQRNLVAFISDVTGNPDLFIHPFSPEEGAKDKPRQIFSAKKASQGSPTFSPDGSQVAFVTNKDGSPRIYVIDIPVAGQPLKDVNAKLLTKHSKESSAPAWSSDGSKLAYCAMTNGNRQIWVYDFTTKQERQLTQSAGNKENPTWSPNSLCLAYNSSDTGFCELYLININQPEPVKISSGSGEKRFPSWEPKG